MLVTQLKQQLHTIKQSLLPHCSQDTLAAIYNKACPQQVLGYN